MISSLWRAGSSILISLHKPRMDANKRELVLQEEGYAVVGCAIEMIFLSAGLKYHDTTVRVRSSNEGNKSFTESPDAICENTAPDITKKKPA